MNWMCWQQRRLLFSHACSFRHRRVVHRHRPFTFSTRTYKRQPTFAPTEKCIIVPCPYCFFAVSKNLSCAKQVLCHSISMSPPRGNSARLAWILVQLILLRSRFASEFLYMANGSGFEPVRGVQEYIKFDVASAALGSFSIWHIFVLPI